MRIAYIAHVNGAGRSGVVRKISWQAEQWRATGHEVRVLLMTREARGAWQASLGDGEVARYEGLWSRMRAAQRLVHAAGEFAPAIVYVRRDLFYPQMLRLPRSAALVVEVNDNDLAEYALGPRIRALYNARTRGILLGRARGLVFVTHELSASAAFHGYSGARVVVSNGIRLSDYPTFAAPVNERPQFVFIGTPGQPWHGVDKLVTLADMNPDWRFDVIGARSETRTPSRNITWHGPLEAAAALRIMARADIGVGTLALHRVGLDESCSLKVREYLAIGLPVLYGNRDLDVDFLGDAALRIANTETNVVDALPRIQRFVDLWRGRRVPRSSVAHIDIAEKERERLILFESLVGA